MGEGPRRRDITIPKEALKSLEKYLDEARPRLVHNNKDEKAIFLNRLGKRLTRQGFWQILKTYARKANLDSKVTSHTLRHSYATHMLNKGANLHEVQKSLGHASVSTTQVYAQLSSK